MRVLVTGGAGFIGSNLCRHLLSAGHSVVVLDDLSTGYRHNLDGLDVTLHIGSITDAAALELACDGASTVVHLAARGSVPKSLDDPMATHHANATGTAMVLEAARAVGAHVLVASSSSVYGANPTLPKHEDLVPQPVSPYAASKLATESYALAWARSFGMDVLAFRFFNVFGPRQPAGHAYAAVIPAFVDAALSGQPIPIHGDGMQSRDFTFVDTVCGVITDAVGRRLAHPGPVNLAFGTRVTLLEVVDEIERQLGTPLERQHAPRRAGDVDHSQADTSRLRALFPDVQPVVLADGIRATIDWMRSAR